MVLSNSEHTPSGSGGVKVRTEVVGGDGDPRLGRGGLISSRPLLLLLEREANQLTTNAVHLTHHQRRPE